MSLAARMIVAVIACLAASSAAAATVVLYDASLGNTPDAQGFWYLTNELFPSATKSFDATTIATTTSTAGKIAPGSVCW
ncbi:MAG: hypothetical protein A2V70_11415 [Planctomycetes bacterium RBG_13_63_9]|nr:MAG: hypothetical protein A2V70_11415 [Planctomycetes bacterium RBG_13_63_9]